jgi:acetylornithine/succinyldiaminopimelate/putrescine aminotransferase
VSEHLLGTYARFPVTFARGEGVTLWDDEGHEYLDFLSGISVSSVGHCHPAVVAAVQEQAARLLHVGNLYFTEPMSRLAERLAISSLGGGVFFTNSGAEAVEAALKLARKAKRGGEIVVAQGGFHGRTYGALSATPQEAKQAPFAPLVPGFVPVEPTAEAITGAVHDGTAAVVLEPVQGESGVHPLSDETLRAAREACDRHGASLVFDEIQCGLARTGTLWCYEQSGVVPDAMTTAKALGGGLPIGALITGERLRACCSPATTARPSPAARSSPRRPTRRSTSSRTRRSTRACATSARCCASGSPRCPASAPCRGRGLMNAFDLADGGAPELVRRLLLEQRLVANATGPATVRLLPALTVDESHLDDALGRLQRLLA